MRGGAENCPGDQGVRVVDRFNDSDPLKLETHELRNADL